MPNRINGQSGPNPLAGMPIHMVLLCDTRLLITGLLSEQQPLLRVKLETLVQRGFQLVYECCAMEVQWVQSSPLQGSSPYSLWDHIVKIVLRLQVCIWS